MNRAHAVTLSTVVLAAGLSLPAAAEPQQATAASAAIGAFRTLELGMPADAAKAAMGKLGGSVVEVGESVLAERILRTEVAGVDGGPARLWVDIHDGKVANISVVRDYDTLDKTACQAKFADRQKEVAAQYGGFDQPNRWQDSQELYVAASRTKARISRDGRVLELLGTHAAGSTPQGLTAARNHINYCVVSVEMRSLEWEQQRRAASGM